MIIGSHNTFSYLKSNLFWELFSPWWRCQDTKPSEFELYLIDIRVSYSPKNGEFRLCHGSIKFKPKFYSLRSVIDFCWHEAERQRYYRLIFSNKSISKEGALELFNTLPDDYKFFCNSCIYQPTWEYIYNDKYKPSIHENNKHMWYSNKSFWYNITHFLFPTIKRYAKRNNTINREKYKDSVKVEMFDYNQY